MAKLSSEDQAQYDSLHISFKDSVRAIGGIAQDYYALLREVNAEASFVSNGYRPEDFDRLIERSNSELLSIAFFGAFSSGKSFLISALCNGVTYGVQRENDRDREHYTSLIPASPRPTSSCPLAVEPLPESEKENRFWVFFADSTDWEEKTPVIPAVIQAYATALPNALMNRFPSADRTRSVIKARLGIASAPLKARLYDLPGIGSAFETHEQVVRQFVQQADCIVYVAWAVRTLGSDDLSLLRHVYEHHKRTGKPVFFVLTQIDKGMQADSESSGDVWEDVRESNNEFLRKYFCEPESGQPDVAFIGHGFLPVSAALEAQSKYYASFDPGGSDRCATASNMGRLRALFDEYLRTTTGPIHLVELAHELHKLLIRMVQDISARHVVEKTPVSDAQVALAAERERRSLLIEGKDTLRKQLATLGEAALAITFGGTDVDDLTALLRKEIGPKIRTRDVLRDDVIEELANQQAQTVRVWAAGNAGALIPRWVKAWESFVEQSNERVGKLILESRPPQGEFGDLTPDASILPPKKEVVGNVTRGAFDAVFKAWQTYAVISGIGGGGVALASGVASAGSMVLLGPMGWAALASAFLGGGVAAWRLRTERRSRRTQMVDSLAAYARDSVESYRREAQRTINGRVGQLLSYIDEEEKRVRDSIAEYERRIVSGDYQDAERRLRILAQLIERCNSNEQEIREFYARAHRLQPALPVIE